MNTPAPSASLVEGKTPDGPLKGQVALVTGAAQRIGAHITRRLHQAGANIALHYRHSHDAAQQLACELENLRCDSVVLIQADLLDSTAPERIVGQAVARWGGLDVLVNNASAFYPTPLGSIDEKCWDELLGSNLKAPLFLSQAAALHLRKVRGCIVNMVDIHAQRALDDHLVYCAAKAGLVMLNQSLAKALAPKVRVNALAPGAILPASGQTHIAPEISTKIPLQRTGTLDDIANTVLFLVQPSSYVTGQTITVDGGRSL